MLESPQLDTNEFEGLQNEQTWFNFERTLSETQDPENTPLPEWFVYDENGYIVCEKNVFTYEDYEWSEQPIIKVLQWKLNEWEYLFIDYSDTNSKNRSEISEFYWSRTFIAKKEKQDNYNFSTIGLLFNTIILEKWMKMKIIKKEDEYYKYCNRNKMETEDLLQLGISSNNIIDLFNDNSDNNSIAETINNLWNDLGTKYKSKIFWEYSENIWNINILSWLLRFKLKQKLGNQFNLYMKKFISQLNNINKYITNNELVEYLLSPWCKIDTNNIDEYISYLNENPLNVANLWIYTIQEAREITEYPSFTIKNMQDENTLKTIRKFKQNWITDDMVMFAGMGVQWTILHELHTNFIEELFINETEWKNLFYFLSMYPQKLQNLWWKEIKEIDLSINIRDLYELLQNTNNTENINFTLNERNSCFRWILEMIKSRNDINTIPYPWENANEQDINKWKENREKIIKEYETLIKSYIWLDFYENPNWEKKEKNRENTFDKIFYSMAVWEEDHNWAFRNAFNKEHLQSFSKNKISDYSNILDENGNIVESKHKEMINKICEYAEADQHKNEKILVFIWTHWAEDWYSANGWNKDDWLKISKYPNIKIMSTRCFFWSVYNSEDNWSWDYIHSQQSQLSWFSNKTRGRDDVEKVLIEWFNKWLWFHELELYARLHYDIISPLTENLEYTDRSTWEKRQSNIWLAYEWEWNIFENNV